MSITRSLYGASQPYVEVYKKAYREWAFYARDEHAFRDTMDHLISSVADLPEDKYLPNVFDSERFPPHLPVHDGFAQEMSKLSYFRFLVDQVDGWTRAPLVKFHVALLEALFVNLLPAGSAPRAREHYFADPMKVRSNNPNNPNKVTSPTP
jgi:hypothetical protein